MSLTRRTGSGFLRFPHARHLEEEIAEGIAALRAEGEPQPAATCPICGQADVDTITYDQARKDMRVQHGGNISCSRAPVDEHGNYL